MAASHRRPDRQPGSGGSTRTTVTLIVVGVVVVALLAITGIAALLRVSGDGNDRGARAAATSSTSASAVSPSPSPSGTATTPPTTPPTRKATTSAPAATTPTGSTHASTTFTGRGNQVLKIKKPGGAGAPALVVATHQGSGSFGVLALDSTMHDSDILINVAGSYQGTTLLDAQGTHTLNLEVRAHGPWTVKIKPVTAARSVDARAKGAGDDVLRYTGISGLATFDCRGGLNFVVTYHGAKANTVLVNEVGRYHGQVRIQKGPALIAVKANAAWTMKVAP